MYYWAHPSYGNFPLPISNIYYGEGLQHKGQEWTNKRQGANSREAQPQSYDERGFQEVLTHSQQSLYALEVQCSFATQMKLTESTKNLPGLQELHRHNYESSYHRTTAMGCLYRILSGERHRHVVGIMIHCMIESEEHDRASQQAIQQMKQHATGAAERWVDIVQRWQSQQMRELQEAMQITRGLVGEQFWRYAMGLEY